MNTTVYTLAPLWDDGIGIIELKLKSSENEAKLHKYEIQEFYKKLRIKFLLPRANMALLYSNTGKLMRLCAQVYGNSTKFNYEENRGQFTQQEETYFNKVWLNYLTHLNNFLSQTSFNSAAVKCLIILLSFIYRRLNFTAKHFLWCRQTQIFTASRIACCLNCLVLIFLWQH